jgi:hypothetical protein
LLISVGVSPSDCALAFAQGGGVTDVDLRQCEFKVHNSEGVMCVLAPARGYE